MACVEDSLISVEVRMALSGRSAHLALPLESSFQDLRLALQATLDVPVAEQVLRIDAVNPAEAYEVRGSENQLLANMDLPSGTALVLIRQDPRTTSEKNCALLDALAERRFDTAAEVLNSSGFPVDPNCVYKWTSNLRGWLCGGPDARKNFGDVRESTTSALSLAIRARKTWDTQGRISGDGLEESAVLPIIRSLLDLGADVHGASVEVHTCGSWPAETESKTPLYLAVETGSVEIASLLLNAGADPASGKVARQFKDKPESCMAALHKSGGLTCALEQELTDLLQVQMKAVCMSTPA